MWAVFILIIPFKMKRVLQSKYREQKTILRHAPAFVQIIQEKWKKKRPSTAAPLTSPPPSGTFVCLEKIWEQAPTFEKE